MYFERRLVSYIALLLATIYYFFGRAEAATLPLATDSSISVVIVAPAH